MKIWKTGFVAGSFLCLSLGLFTTRAVAQEGPPGGNADVIRAQLEKLQSTLKEIERRDEQRGKVTEIGSSRGRIRDVDEPRLVVKVYDLSDLFTVAPSYPAYEPTELIRGSELQPVFPHVASAGGGAAAGGFGGGGGLFAVPSTVDRQPFGTLNQGSGASGAPATDVRTSMQSLIDTITSTIDPDGWADVGGPSTVAPVGSSLLISTTSETHAKLTALIDLFRQRWGSLRTISVQAHWLWLSPTQVDEVLVQPKAGAAPAQEISLNTVTPGEWKKLLAAASEKEGAAAGYHSIVTCYNGQTVATQAGAQRIVVTGITPVVAGGQQAAVAYTPVTRTVHEGATLQITPLATRHVKYVVLDVHSRVNLLTPNPRALEKVEKVESGPIAPRQVVDALDRVSLQTQRLETTLRVPVGLPTLIGGMTFSAAEGKNSHLYLFITTKVQELRDDEPTVAPAVKSDAAEDKPQLEKK